MSSKLGKFEFWDFLGFYAIQVYGCGLIPYPQWSFIADLKVHANFLSSWVNDQPLKSPLGYLCVYLCHVKYFSCILPFYLFCVFFSLLHPLACSLWYVQRIINLGHSHTGIEGRYMWVFIASDQLYHFATHIMHHRTRESRINKNSCSQLKN